jgi:hypothetical protein
VHRRPEVRSLADAKVQTIAVTEAWTISGPQACQVCDAMPIPSRGTLSELAIPALYMIPRELLDGEDAVASPDVHSTHLLPCSHCQVQVSVGPFGSRGRSQLGDIDIARGHIHLPAYSCEDLIPVLVPLSRRWVASKPQTVSTSIVALRYRYVRRG